MNLIRIISGFVRDNPLYRCRARAVTTLRGHGPRAALPQPDNSPRRLSGQRREPHWMPFLPFASVSYVGQPLQHQCTR